MDFNLFIQAIGSSKSKQEEDNIITLEVQQMKRYLAEPGGPSQSQKKKNKEFLLRLIYVEMLGLDASFGYIKAVEMTASQNIVYKKTAYLCCSLCLCPDHEFRVMLVNQIKRDLSSSNYLETCAALSGLCKLVTLEMVPAVIDQVANLLSHNQVAVRKKAIMVFHRLQKIDPELIKHYYDVCRKSLYDKDPSVMGASLCLLYDLVYQDSHGFRDLVPSFVAVLRQIIDHRLPRCYDYHRIPAPWIQMKLLQILALLGHANQTASEGMYELLRSVMRRADSGTNIGYAVVYECVRTVVTIYPNSSLLDLAAEKISIFLRSRSHNMKYMGVTGLAAIVKEYPQYATDHQLAVIDCLEDPDETLKRKTLGLLYSMTNSVNVEFITAKLLSFLEGSTDTFWRNELVWRITQSAEAFAPSNSWYVGVMTQVFKVAGELVEPDVAPNLLALIAEGCGDDSEADQQLRCDAANTCAELLDCRATLPDSLVQIMAWVLGEYCHLITVEEDDDEGEHLPQERIAEQLCAMARDRKFKDPATRGCIVTALLKLAAQSGTVPAIVADFIDHFCKSCDSDLQQRCLEFQALVQRGDIMGSCLPMDASCEDLELDESLSFLSEISGQAIEKGAPLYCTPLDLDDALPAQGERMGSPSLRFAHYSNPESSPSNSVLAAFGGPITDLAKTIQHSSGSVGNSSPGPVDVMQDSNNPMEVIKLKAKGITKVWGAGGAVETDWSKTKPYASSANAPPPPLPPSLPAVSNLTTTATGNQPHADSFSEKKKADLTPKQKTPEELEKERMAAALFGGIGNAQTNRRGVTRSRQGQWGQQRVGDACKISSTASGGTVSSAIVSQDLLDMSFDMPGGGMEERGVTLNNQSGAHSNSSSPPLHHDVQSTSHSVASVFEGMTVKSAVSGVSTSTESIHGIDYAQCDAPSPNLLDIEGIQSHGSVPEVGYTTAPKGSELEISHDDLSTMFAKDIMDSTKTATTLPGGNGMEGQHRTTTFSWDGHTMQPLLINTHEFGKDWTGSNMTERTLVGLKCGQHPFRTPEDVMQVLSWCGLHPVESIAHTSEGICAGTCSSIRLLSHFKLQPHCAAINLTVHCQNDNISDAFLLHLKQNIASSSMESNDSNNH